VALRCGIFGKLQSKRDFIAVSVPRQLLGVWEQWLQAGMSASRDKLGSTWNEAFLTAPIWRFWLGADIAGVPVLGAVMPSIDGVGRYFPLTLLACGEPGALPPTPDVDPQDAWFASVEDFLLATLDPALRYEDVLARLEALPPAAGIAGATSIVGSLPGTEAIAASFASARMAAPQLASAASFWWTAGGGGYEPRTLACSRLPDPFLFSAMLTGRFEDRGPVDPEGVAHA